MFQALGGGICYITGRFFVYEGEKAATPHQLLQEILLCLLFFVVCFVCYSIFHFNYGRVEKQDLLMDEAVLRVCFIKQENDERKMLTSSVSLPLDSYSFHCCYQ